MTAAESRKKTPQIIYFIILLLPYLLFYWMLPFIAPHSLGQDYQTIGIQSQMELLFSIKTGSFPLYVPGFAFGNSSSALTLGQLYHPMAHLSSILPGYWSGNALEWNTFLRLLSIGLTHLALFVFLRRLTVNAIYSFLLSLIAVYNLRMLDLFRYGASLEAYTGYILLCVAIGWHFIEQKKLLYSLSIIFMTYWLVCSGHTQMMYYGLLGAGLFTLVAPYFISEMLTEKQPDIKTVLKFWLKASFFLILGIVLSSAYVFPFYFDFMATNTGRVGQSYDWSLAYGDALIGTLNSFFLPFRSDVHGNFGGTSLFTIVLILPILKLFKVKIPKSIWIIWGIFLLSFLYMQGDRTPVHKLAWEYLPFASSFRTPGRIAFIIPFFIMMLLAWLVHTGTSSRLKIRSVTLSPLTIVSSASIVVTFLYVLIFALSTFFNVPAMTEVAHFTPVNIRKIPTFAEVCVLFSGIFALMLFALCGALQKRFYWTGIILCLVTLLQTGIILKYGTWITEQRTKPTFEQMLSEKKESLGYRHHPGSGLYSSVIDAQIRHSFAEPFLAKIYFDIVPVESQEAAYLIMQQHRLPQQIFIENYNYTPGQSLYTKEKNSPLKNGQVELVYSSFNRLKFKVITNEKAMLSLSYPYTGHWNAWVNNAKARVYRANGAAHAVQIDEGESFVEFRYWSNAAFMGMLISCLTFILIGFFYCSKIDNKNTKLFSLFMTLCIGVGGFLLWYNSLYKGRNLESAYLWEYSNPLPIPNIAYGKKTWASSSLAGGFELLHYSSRAVDGHISPASGFSTAREDNPFLAIDLHHVQKVHSIFLYESINNKESNVRLLTIASSVDGTQWHNIANIESSFNRSNPARIILDTPISARYIKIQASGYCNLRLNEVEIYGKDNI